MLTAAVGAALAVLIAELVQRRAGRHQHRVVGRGRSRERGRTQRRGPHLSQPGARDSAEPLRRDRSRTSCGSRRDAPPVAPVITGGAARDRRRGRRRAFVVREHLVARRSRVPGGDRRHGRAWTDANLSSTAQTRIVNSTLGDFHDATTQQHIRVALSGQRGELRAPDARGDELAHGRQRRADSRRSRRCCRPRSTGRPATRCRCRATRASSLGCESSRPTSGDPTLEAELFTRAARANPYEPSYVAGEATAKRATGDLAGARAAVDNGLTRFPTDRGPPDRGGGDREGPGRHRRSGRIPGPARRPGRRLTWADASATVLDLADRTPLGCRQPNFWCHESSRLGFSLPRGGRASACSRMRSRFPLDGCVDRNQDRTTTRRLYEVTVPQVAAVGRRWYRRPPRRRPRTDRDVGGGAQQRRPTPRRSRSSTKPSSVSAKPARRRRHHHRRQSTDTFNAGDQITVQVAQPGVGTPDHGWRPTAAAMNAELQRRHGRLATRRPRHAAIVASSSYRCDPDGGWPDGWHAHAACPAFPASSTPAGVGGTVPGFCNAQDGGTKQRHLHVHRGHDRPRADHDQQRPVRRRSWHRPGEQHRSDDCARTRPRPARSVSSCSSRT